MRILGINTATSNTEIALTEGKNILTEKSWPSSRDEAEKILPVLQELLAPAAFDKIFVVEGPGPFTALRLGVTIANTLGFVYNVPLISLNTFQYFLRKIPEKQQKNTAIILKAGGGFFSVLLPEAKEPKTLSLNEFLQFFKNTAVHFLTGDVFLQDQKEISETIGIRWIEEGLKTFGEVIIHAADLEEYRIAEPYYLQPPKITQSKKKIFH